MNLQEFRKLIREEVRNVIKEKKSRRLRNESFPGALGRLFSRDRVSAEKVTVDNNSIEFEGRKFTQDQIEYDDYQSTKPIPRIEGNKLIIANPFWSE